MNISFTSTTSLSSLLCMMMAHIYICKAHYPSIKVPKGIIYFLSIIIFIIPLYQILYNASLILVAPPAAPHHNSTHFTPLLLYLVVCTLLFVLQAAFIYMYTCVYVCICVYMYICMYAYIYVYIHIYLFSFITS